MQKNHDKRGLFITFEGGEGAGKSTQINLMAEELTKSGHTVDITREPGGTPGAEAIRRLLVEGSADSWDAMTETVLFLAARLDHVRKRIIPALREGKIVLCDRFSDSTRVYQGVGKGMDDALIALLHAETIGEFKPDLTILLDIDPEEGLRRAGARAGNENRFESMDLAFHRRIREGFLALAKAEPQRFAIIDAAQPVERVQADIVAAVRKVLSLRA